MLSKEKSALLPVFQRIEEANIGSVPVLSSHKILGVWIDNKRRLHQNSVEVLIKCRKGSDLDPNVPQKVQLPPTKTSVRISCSVPDGLPSASNLSKDDEISQASMESRGVQSGADDSGRVSDSVGKHSLP